jgi:hypothetical protein
MSTNSSKLIEAQGAWLKTFTWDFYFTGTFAQPVTENGARFLLTQYVARLETASSTSVSMFWTVEKGTIGGNVHVHGLIGNTGTLPASCGSEFRSCTSVCATHLWHVGKAQVRLYDANGAAPYYISKTAFFRDSEWGIIGNPAQSFSSHG